MHLFEQEILDWRGIRPFFERPENMHQNVTKKHNNVNFTQILSSKEKRMWAEMLLCIVNMLLLTWIPLYWLLVISLRLQIPKIIIIHPFSFPPLSFIFLTFTSTTLQPTLFMIISPNAFHLLNFLFLHPVYYSADANISV